jgi:hypothetical protein
MGAKRIRFRPTKRQAASAHNAAIDFYAAASENPRAAEAPRSAIPKQRAAPRQLEAPVVAAVAELLAVHPKVLFAVRQNSGAASYEHSSGRYAPVWFYRVVTRQPVTITDFWGILRDGRMFAIECKRPGWKAPHGDREMRQALFIMLVRNVGGVGGFVTSADQLGEILK